MGKPDESIVYKDRVDAAIQKIYIDQDEEGSRILATSKLLKQNSTMTTMLKRTMTADRVADPNDVEDQDDSVFTQKTNIKVDQNPQTFTTCVGILKHPEVEEPIDVEQIAKEAQVATIDAFLKKQVVEEPIVVDQAAEGEQQQQRRLKPVIKQKPSRAAEPLGWKNPATENEKQIIEVFKRFGKERVDIMDMDQLTDLLKYNVDESYLKGLIKIHDSDKDGELDEVQFVEAYKILSGMQKAEVPENDRYEQLFYTMDVMKDDKILPDIYKQFCDRLGIESQIEDIIPRSEFRQRVPRECVVAFFGEQLEEGSEEEQSGEKPEGEKPEGEKPDGEEGTKQMPYDVVADAMGAGSPKDESKQDEPGSPQQPASKVASPSQDDAKNPYETIQQAAAQQGENTDAAANPQPAATAEQIEQNADAGEQNPAE